MDDNHQDDCLPFKGPFKGKGQTRKVVRQLETELAGVLAEMALAVGNFNTAFPTTPRPVNLRIQNRPTAHALLNWRQSRHSGSYLHLFGTAAGDAILSRLGPNATALLGKFDRERLRLNFRSKLIWSALHAYRLHHEGLNSQTVWFETSQVSAGFSDSAP